MADVEMTDLTDSIVDTYSDDFIGKDNDAIANETKAVESLKAEDSEFSSLSVDPAGNITKNGETIKTDYKGQELPISETLKNEIMEQKYNDADSDPESAEKSAEKMLSATLGDNVPETVKDATTKKITEKIRQARNADPNYPQTVSLDDLKTLNENFTKNGNLNDPKSQEIIKNAIKAPEFVTKEQFDKTIENLKNSPDTKLARNAEEAEKKVEEEGLFKKYGGKLAWLVLCGFLFEQVGRAFGANRSGCMSSSSRQSATGQTTNQICKVSQFTCPPNEIGNDCNIKDVTCQGAKGETKFDQCTKGKIGGACDITITSNPGVLPGDNGIKCSAFCSNDYLATQVGDTSYSYNCVYCDALCGMQGVFQMLAKIAAGALEDAAGLFGIFGNILKYGLFGLMIIFVIWIIYKVLSSRSNGHENQQSEHYAP